MTYLLEVPVDSGGRLLVQASDSELPAELELAALRPGEVVGRARESVEHAIDELKPAMTAVYSRMKAMAADEVTVEVAIILGAETGAIVAKGTAEAHFKVTATWKHGASSDEKSKSVPASSHS